MTNTPLESLTFVLLILLWIYEEARAVTIPANAPINKDTYGVLIKPPIIDICKAPAITLMFTLCRVITPSKIHEIAILLTILPENAKNRFSKACSLFYCV